MYVLVLTDFGKIIIYNLYEGVASPANLTPQ